MFGSLEPTRRVECFVPSALCVLLCDSVCCSAHTGRQTGSRVVFGGAKKAWPNDGRCRRRLSQTNVSSLVYYSGVTGRRHRTFVSGFAFRWHTYLLMLLLHFARVAGRSLPATVLLEEFFALKHPASASVLRGIFVWSTNIRQISRFRAHRCPACWHTRTCLK